MTPREARAVAKGMLRAIAKIPPRLSHSLEGNPEFFERAAVLADVALESNHPEVGEALALAVQGRVSGHPRYAPDGALSKYPGLFDSWGVGARLPPGEVVGELISVVRYAAQVLNPPRHSPCMPNREELWQLVARAQGEDAHGRRLMSDLWSSLQTSCEARSYGTTEKALRLADGALGGHGLVFQRMRELYPGAQRVAAASFEYVDMGDIFKPTLCFVPRWNKKSTHRYVVTPPRDLAEAAERRYPRGEWEGQPYDPA